MNFLKEKLKRRSLLTLLGIGTLWGADKAMANVPNTFTNGQVADANQVNENFNTVYAIVPIGGVMPWHKSLNVSVVLPDQWVECNGQTIVDAASPFDGLTVPDLNGATGEHGGKGLFLRGGTSSGNFEEDQMQSHKHDDSGHTQTDSWWNNEHPNGIYSLSGGVHIKIKSSARTGYANLGDPTDSGTGAGEPRHGAETRPINMSMVWIIRIK